MNGEPTTHPAENSGPAEVHCSGCGELLGIIDSPNSDVYETGEATHEKRINASVRTPMVSVAVLLNVKCTDCSDETE